MKISRLKNINILFSVILLVAITACSSHVPNESTNSMTVNSAEETIQEEQPIEIKYVGSHELQTSMIRYPTFGDFVLDADEIVIGKVKSAETQEGYLREIEEGLPDPPAYNETYYNIIVDETMTGENLDSLLLCLYGTPESDFGMTKPKIGDDVVLFLSKNENGTFATTSMETSIFRINKDNTVYSFSNDEITAQFDGKSIDSLKEEISKAQKGDFSERYYSFWNEEYQSELREKVQRHNNS